jgi:hypothetical protein
MLAHSSSNQWPLGILFFGVLFVVLGTFGTFAGKTYGKGKSVVRAEDPFDYWTTLAVQYLCGAALIWYQAFGLG